MESPQRRIDGVLAPLLNELAALPHDVVLVLDDFHVIDAPEIQEGMAYLLDHLPERALLSTAWLAAEIARAAAPAAHQMEEIGTRERRRWVLTALGPRPVALAGQRLAGPRANRLVASALRADRGAVVGAPVGRRLPRVAR